ncbi:MAG: 1-acyl-sn-glycerol-3-phosphate acyltransferase [Pseudomonadota bacterium]
MADDPANAQTAPAKVSAFAVPERRADKHIVDELIEERCPTFSSHWSWPFLRPFLFSLLGYGKAREMADRLVTMNGQKSFDHLAETLDFRLNLDFFERIPRSGRVVVAANHPTGLADGAAVWQALRQVREDIVFFANADAMRVNPRFSDTLIPVEWLMEKRSPAKTRETLRLAGDAFAQEKCVVIFPSGRLAKMVDRKLTEQDWFPTAVGLARKKNAPVLPLNVGARNSRLYYLFSTLNAELRDITLFHELLNKKRSRFTMTAGPLISPEDLAGDTGEVTTALQDYVAYRLAGDPHTPFRG